MVKTVGIVSLSSGILGEDLVKHELEIGVKRLLAMGLTVRFMPHALKGSDTCGTTPKSGRRICLRRLRTRRSI